MSWGEALKVDEDHIQDNYECPKCGHYLLIKGSIIPRNPNWYCYKCGNEGPLKTHFKVSP